MVTTFVLRVQIFRDGMGYGFIIRGAPPCFVKIVDPDSPAGRSGLKVSGVFFMRLVAYGRFTVL